MAKLSELTLKADTIPGDFDTLPEQLGVFTDPPQPGSYRFKMPSQGALEECWGDPFDNKEGQQRIAALHRDGAELTITQSPNGRYNGDLFDTRVTNAERKRGKGEEKASDMDYILLACKHPGRKPQNNKEYALAYQGLGSKEFGGDIEWSWFCNENKPIRVADEQNGSIVCDGLEGRPDAKGCGTRYYQKVVDRQPNEKGELEFPRIIQCTCGAQLRAYAQIARFRE